MSNNPEQNTENSTDTGINTLGTTSGGTMHRPKAPSFESSYGDEALDKFDSSSPRRSSETTPNRFHNNRKLGSHISIDGKRFEDPPDGGWGWVIVAAVWLDNMCVLGMLKSFPVLYGAFKQEEWEDEPENLNFKVALISSLSLSMRATCAPVAAALTNKYNERIEQVGI